MTTQFKTWTLSGLTALMVWGMTAQLASAATQSNIDSRILTAAKEGGATDAQINVALSSLPPNPSPLEVGLALAGIPALSPSTLGSIAQAIIVVSPGDQTAQYAILNSVASGAKIDQGSAAYNQMFYMVLPSLLAVGGDVAGGDVISLYYSGLGSINTGFTFGVFSLLSSFGGKTDGGTQGLGAGGPNLNDFNFRVGPYSTAN